MKRIISMAILLVMALSMVLQPAYAADVATAEYVFRLAGEQHDKANADTTKVYADSFSGNWSWYGKSWASDAATTAIFRQSNKATYNANDRIYVQDIAVGEWFALDIKAPEASGIYSVDFDYSRLSSSNAGACDIYFIEKPDGESNAQAVNTALVNSSPIGNINCGGASVSIEKITKKLDNIVFKEGKSYLLVFKATKVSNIPINGMKITKIGDVGKLTEVSASVEKSTISVGDTLSIVISGKDSNGVELKADNFDTIRYSSSDSDVATVVDGVITAVANGSATITVTATLGDVTKTAELNVIVVSTEKYLFSGVKDTWTKLQDPENPNYKTIKDIPYNETITGNWAWHSKSTASDNFKVFAIAQNSRLQVGGMQIGDWFAIKIKSPGTGKWQASLEYVAYKTAGTCDVYIFRSCDESEVGGFLKSANKAGTINFKDVTLTEESTKIETLKAFPLYQDREYLVVFKTTTAGNIRPNQLILTEIPGAEIEEEKEYVSPNASFAETTNIDGFDGINIRSVRRGATVTLTAHKEEIEGYRFVGWKRGADTSDANAWVDVSEDKYRVWSNTYLTAIYEPVAESGDKVVEFWNQNGAYIGKMDEETYNAQDELFTPKLIGFGSFRGWFTDGNVEFTAKQTLAAGTTNAVAQYTASAVSGVTFDGDAITGADTYNKEITLPATSEATTCWKRDGEIIAYGSSYKFNVWDATNITEGTEEIVDKVPVAILDYSEKHKAYMFEYDAGECEIAEAGIIFGGESIDSCEKKYTSQRKVLHNQFTVPEEDDLSAKGYIIYRLNDGSNYEVKYFTVAE